MDQGRAATGCPCMAMEGGAGKARKRPLMASNEKPRRRAGLDGPGEMALRLDCCSSVMEILTDCSSHVNHPTTFDARYWEHSLKPVGEERGAILKSVQRPPIYGHAAQSWEAWRRTGKTRKSCQQRMAPSVINPCEWVRPCYVCSPHGITISHLPQRGSK